MSLKPLFGLTLDELRAFAQELGAPAFVGNQLANGLYRRRVSSFDQMTDLSKNVRQTLVDTCELGIFPPSRVDASVDGTRKYLFPAGERFIESAYIPDEERKTLCVSSQVGCKMGCLFCMTGKQGFQKNLTSGEILNQIRSLPEGPGLTNVVYMGMGEPLDNLDQTLKSLEVLTSEWGLGLGIQRVTVSSIGIFPALEEFFAKTKVRFALSLHSPFDEERRSLMPIQSVYPLESVLAFLKKIQETDGRRLSVEYICFGGLNDTPRHAKELVRILHGLKIRVNLIKFHPIPGTPLPAADPKGMEFLRDELSRRGIPATIRRSRGEDIYAACGLLSTKAKISPF